MRSILKWFHLLPRHFYRQALRVRGEAQKEMRQKWGMFYIVLVYILATETNTIHFNITCVSVQIL